MEMSVWNLLKATYLLTYCTLPKHIEPIERESEEETAVKNLSTITEGEQRRFLNASMKPQTQNPGSIHTP